MSVCVATKPGNGGKRRYKTRTVGLMRRIGKIGRPWIARMGKKFNNYQQT